MDEEKEEKEVSGPFTWPEDGRHLLQTSERWKKKHYLTRPREDHSVRITGE